MKTIMINHSMSAPTKRPESRLNPARRSTSSTFALRSRLSTLSDFMIWLTTWPRSEPTAQPMTKITIATMRFGIRETTPSPRLLNESLKLELHVSNIENLESFSEKQACRKKKRLGMNNVQPNSRPPSCEDDLMRPYLALRDCCRMAKSSFLPRRNKGYFGQKVTKTLFGNSPFKFHVSPRSFCLAKNSKCFKVPGK